MKGIINRILRVLACPLILIELILTGILAASVLPILWIVTGTWYDFMTSVLDRTLDFIADGR